MAASFKIADKVFGLATDGNDVNPKLTLTITYRLNDGLTSKVFIMEKVDAFPQDWSDAALAGYDVAAMNWANG